MDQKLLETISGIVASCINEDRQADIKNELDKVLGEKSTHDKMATLAVTPVYALVAEQPGYPVDGKPGYLPMDADLKAAVLSEIQAMIEADFDKCEHMEIWKGIEKNVAATPPAEFLPGVAVNCPDDYLLTLDKLFASEVLRQYNALPSWV